MCSGRGNWTLLQLGFPIRKSPDHSSVANFPGLIAGSYVLHRLLVPRHPPCALSSLSCYKDARVHCVVLKIRAVPPSGTRLPADVVRRQFEGMVARRNRSLDPSGPNSVPDVLLDATLEVPLRDPPTSRWRKY